MSPVSPVIMQVIEPGPPAFQQFRTEISGGLAKLDEYDAAGAHLQRRPNSSVDLTTIAPANWIMPDDLPSASGGPKYAQTLPGESLGLGKRPVIWWHTKLATARWDHISVWDPQLGALYSTVEERVEDVNGHPKACLSQAVWLSPHVYYGRVTSVDGAPPTVTLTIYRANQILGSEASWASRVIPSGEFDPSTVVAAVAEPRLIISDNGTVGLSLSVSEYDSIDTLLGSFRYSSAWTSDANFLGEANPASLTLNGGYPGGGLTTRSCHAGGANGLDGLLNPNFAVSGGWPSTGAWAFEKTFGFTVLSLTPDRSVAAAVDTPSLVTQQVRVIWAAANATSGDPTADIDPALDPDGKSSANFLVASNLT